MIEVISKGSFEKTEKYLDEISNIFKNHETDLAFIGAKGVDSLRANTPSESGTTANAWRFELSDNSISWYNDNTNDGECIAILLQYGHGTGTGGYFEGVDYINPAMEPIYLEFSKYIEDKMSKI